MFQSLKIKRKITFHLLIAKEGKDIKKEGMKLHLLVLNHPSLCLNYFFFNLHILAKKHIWTYVNICFCGDI